MLCDCSRVTQFEHQQLRLMSRAVRVVCKKLVFRFLPCVLHLAMKHICRYMSVRTCFCLCPFAPPFPQAIRLDPKEPLAHLGTAQVYLAASGEVTNVVSELELVLQTLPGGWVAVTVQSDCWCMWGARGGGTAICEAARINEVRELPSMCVPTEDEWPFWHSLLSRCVCFMCCRVHDMPCRQH